eukprot:CAMPEP_0174245052 /NCGR_PEP_ID=MMETSP0417-20130205/37492_1 /TAXON_ID=242541 /ORGANISM="Mayorella sp, Strain BSH-02190019" /LENGTH=140 /DNA_ID=CAMNT_0015324799 /DNA_START=52 /DNA_END=470 /DNA_ORIENTATION=-
MHSVSSGRSQPQPSSAPIAPPSSTSDRPAPKMQSQLTATLQRLVEYICSTAEQPTRTVSLLHYSLRILSARLQPPPAVPDDPSLASTSSDSPSRSTAASSDPAQRDGHAAILALQHHVLGRVRSGSSLVSTSAGEENSVA